MRKVSLRLIFFFMMTFVVSSCATLRRPKVHLKMYKDVKNCGYDLSLKELKKVVLDSIKSNFAKAPLIVLPRNDIEDKTFFSAQKIEKDIRLQGFYYKKKFYFGKKFNFFEYFSGESEDRLNFKKIIINRDLHIFEDTENKFIILSGANIYIGEKINSSRSKITIKRMREVDRDYQKLKLDKYSKAIFEMFDKKDGIILLENSFTRASRDRHREIELYYIIRPEKAKELEEYIDENI